jgi:hypothetical protein
MAIMTKWQQCLVQCYRPNYYTLQTSDELVGPAAVGIDPGVASVVTASRGMTAVAEVVPWSSLMLILRLLLASRVSGMKEAELWQRYSPQDDTPLTVGICHMLALSPTLLHVHIVL